MLADVSLSTQRSVASQNDAEGKVIGIFEVLWWDSVHEILTKLRGKKCQNVTFSTSSDRTICHAHSWCGIVGKKKKNMKPLCPSMYSGHLCPLTCRLWASSIHLINDQKWLSSASGESQVQGKNSRGLGANVWPRFSAEWGKDMMKEQRGAHESTASVRCSPCLWAFFLFLALSPFCSSAGWTNRVLWVHPGLVCDFSRDSRWEVEM